MRSVTGSGSCVVGCLPDKDSRAGPVRARACRLSREARLRASSGSLDEPVPAIGRARLPGSRRGERPACLRLASDEPERVAADEVELAGRPRRRPYPGRPAPATARDAARPTAGSRRPTDRRRRGRIAPRPARPAGRASARPHGAGSVVIDIGTATAADQPTSGGEAARADATLRRTRRPPQRPVPAPRRIPPPDAATAGRPPRHRHPDAARAAGAWREHGRASGPAARSGRRGGAREDDPFDPPSWPDVAPGHPGEDRRRWPRRRARAPDPPVGGPPRPAERRGRLGRDDQGDRARCARLRCTPPQPRRPRSGRRSASGPRRGRATPRRPGPRPGERLELGPGQAVGAGSQVEAGETQLGRSLTGPVVVRHVGGRSIQGTGRRTSVSPGSRSARSSPSP